MTALAFPPNGDSLVAAQSTATTPQEGTATIELWGLRPTGEQLAATGKGILWRSSPGQAVPALPTPRPGVYRVARVIEIVGSWVLTLDSVQVAESGKATFIISSENTSTVEGQLSCAPSPDPLAASITLAAGQVINSVAAYCPEYPNDASISVPSEGTVESYAVFASSKGLGQPFTLDWNGPDGLSGVLSRVTLSRPALTHGGTVPVLGAAGTGTQGCGTARPDYIYGGGDASDQVAEIRWQSWGSPMAVGEGKALWVTTTVAAGKAEPVRLVAYNLGLLYGQYAYRSLDIYFPQHGQTFKRTSVNFIC